MRAPPFEPAWSRRGRHHRGVQAMRSFCAGSREYDACPRPRAKLRPPIVEDSDRPRVGQLSTRHGVPGMEHGGKRGRGCVVGQGLNVDSIAKGWPAPRRNPCRARRGYGSAPPTSDPTATIGWPLGKTPGRGHIALVSGRAAGRERAGGPPAVACARSRPDDRRATGLRPRGRQEDGGFCRRAGPEEIPDSHGLSAVPSRP